MFNPPNAKAKPSLACLGYLEEMSEPKLTQSGNYYIMRFKLKATAGRDGYGNLLFQPEWFSPDFQPATMGDTSPATVYRMNIVPPVGSGELSVLQGLCGSPDNFKALEQVLLETLPTTAEDIGAVLRAFFLNTLQGNTVLYELRQRKDKSEAADGTVVKVLTDQYELGRFHYPNEDTYKSLAKREAKDPEKFKVAFEIEVPF